MAGTHERDTALWRLQSQAHGELLDAVDRLRSESLGHDLPLPQLIVCGDQSSGKSSVLEAISRVQFPTCGTFCTKFATELKLRSAPSGAKTDVEVRVQPAEHRSESEIARLTEFKPSEEMTKLEDLAKVIKDATKLLQELDPTRQIYEDKLLVTVRQPELPNLTLVDLPGFIHATSGQDGDETIKSVHKLVLSYMKNKHSTILAVLAACNNAETQVVLQLARSVDPNGERTLGIITKPDLVDPGDDAELDGTRLAQNSKIRLELGWHVLRNRKHRDQNVTADDRDNIEAQFFSQGSQFGWKTIPSQNRGADALRIKLADILLRHIAKQFPDILDKVKSRISTYYQEIERLGEPKTTEQEKREQLREISFRLSKLVDAGIEGNYLSSSFFNPLCKDTQRMRRLRASLRDILDEFAAEMRDRGQAYIVLEEPASSSTNHISSAGPLDMQAPQNTPGVPPTVALPAALNEISMKIKQYRGCELEGLIPPQVMAEVFQFQSSKWDSIAAKYITQCHRAAGHFFGQAVFESAPRDIAKGIISELAYHSFDLIETKLTEKRNELLRPYKSGYLITTQKLQLPASDEEYEHSTALQVYDYVQSYYEIACRTFTENVATLVIENCLVGQLGSVFTLGTIAYMSGEMVDTLTREPIKTIEERKTKTKNLNMLQDVLKVCNKHVDRLGNIYRSSLLASAAKYEDASEFTPTRTPSSLQSSVTAQPTVTKVVTEEQPHETSAYPTPPKTPSFLVPDATATQMSGDSGYGGSQSSSRQHGRLSLGKTYDNETHDTPARKGKGRLVPNDQSMQAMYLGED